MEIGELIHVAIGWIEEDHCPFCTDPKDGTVYKTYPGNANNPKTLRDIMKKPELLVTRQEGARPKDEAEGKRRKGKHDESSQPIFSDKETKYPSLHAPVGDYGDEAHHAISGNECMAGEAIEGVIADSGSVYKGPTGYSINNADNGVLLPSWNRKRWRKGEPDGPWKPLPDQLKYDIMKKAMRAGCGQAHIGSHEGHVTAKHPQSYPAFVKGRLKEISDRVPGMSDHCPYCWENDQKTNPLPPPYGVNVWLDTLSRSISIHLKGHPRIWKYFVSEYAARYHTEVCRHGTLAELLPASWPPL